MARRCKLVHKRGKRLRGTYRSCVLTAKGLIDSRSFRWKVSGKRAILVGCPKGKWRRGRCQVGTRAYEVLTKVRQ